VAGCCECGDEPSGSCAAELVTRTDFVDKSFTDYRVFPKISHSLTRHLSDPYSFHTRIFVEVREILSFFLFFFLSFFLSLKFSNFSFVCLSYFQCVLHAPLMSLC
jgi:hypothetical protein